MVFFYGIFVFIFYGLVMEENIKVVIFFGFYLMVFFNVVVFFGVLLGGIIYDKFGRRLSIVFGGLIFVIL